MISYEDATGRRSQGVVFEFQKAKTLIHFDDGQSECHHELLPSAYQLFLERIGQADADSLKAGVQAAVDAQNFSALNLASHELAACTFSWSSD